ncbi:MAG: outer membrane beta-barrel protein [bacterium]|nr:outer membrane beta-barrel protein [bacterium]
MKKSIGILAIGIMALASTQALAKDASKVSAIGVVGYYMPAEKSVADLYGKGIAFGGGLSYEYSPQISIVGAVDYWKGSKEKTATVGTTTVKTDHSLRIMPITCNVIYNIPVQKSAFAPYVGGGIGYYSAEDKKGSVSKSKGAVGFQVLGGCTYPVSSNLSIAAVTRYSVATVKFDDGDKKVGGLTIGGGVAYSF